VGRLEVFEQISIVSNTGVDGPGLGFLDGTTTSSTTASKKERTEHGTFEIVLIIQVSNVQYKRIIFMTERESERAKCCVRLSRCWSCPHCCSSE
jgi:hypothetical protein